MKFYRKAAFSPEAVGHRHLITSTKSTISIKKWAEILNEEFGPKGYKISIDSDVLNEEHIQVDDSRMRNILGITPINLRQTIIDTANSLIEQRLISKPFSLSSSSNSQKKSFTFQYFNKNLSNWIQKSSFENLKCKNFT